MRCLTSIVSLGVFFSVHGLGDPSFKFHHGAPLAFYYSRKFLFGLSHSASTGSTAIDISSIQDIAKYIQGKNTKVVVESTIQTTSNETPHTIVFGKAQSLRKKMDELYNNIKYNCAYRKACLLTICETWLNSSIPDCEMYLDGYVESRQDMRFRQK